MLRLFQATIRDKHDIKVNHIDDYVKQLERLNFKVQKLDVILLVPNDGKAHSFKATNTWNNQTGIKDFVSNQKWKKEHIRTLVWNVDGYLY